MKVIISLLFCILLSCSDSGNSKIYDGKNKEFKKKDLPTSIVRTTPAGDVIIPSNDSTKQVQEKAKCIDGKVNINGELAICDIDLYRKLHPGVCVNGTTEVNGELIVCRRISHKAKFKSYFCKRKTDCKCTKKNPCAVIENKEVSQKSFQPTHVETAQYQNKSEKKRKWYQKKNKSISRQRVEVPSVTKKREAFKVKTSKSTQRRTVEIPESKKNKKRVKQFDIEQNKKTKQVKVTTKKNTEFDVTQNAEIIKKDQAEEKEKDFDLKTSSKTSKQKVEESKEIIDLGVIKLERKKKKTDFEVKHSPEMRKKSEGPIIAKKDPAPIEKTTKSSAQNNNPPVFSNQDNGDIRVFDKTPIFNDNDEEPVQNQRSDRYTEDDIPGN